MKPTIHIRDQVIPTDAACVRDIVTSTGFFTQAEIDIAVELVEARLAHGLASGYEFVFVELSGEVVGYACYGPTPCTDRSYDFYWLAVRQVHRGRGLGGLLLKETEQRIRTAGARVIFLDTASRPQYAPTRAFYDRHGYTQAAVVRAFYAADDDKVIYTKKLVPGPG
ncbi:MAG: GNAT family N-acetyltransferase [Phycisphaerales bacterium]|nr:GNAT family N-acetyltransferase [Phycisphaerales bacterium]